ncbi:hypothetical protein NDU88_000811 [Pleurodeles waltl]|uniref:Uncharacterized protein n=1 Tax=Pleurodeles waltl TaxID=8319 RepID=A0AAV7LVZ3_PLEWA|nr:hypothetical protein NDU88_000811 [Pleurodeles waltl]
MKGAFVAVPTSHACAAASALPLASRRASPTSAVYARGAQKWVTSVARAPSKRPLSAMAEFLERASGPMWEASPPVHAQWDEATVRRGGPSAESPGLSHPTRQPYIRPLQLSTRCLAPAAQGPEPCNQFPIKASGQRPQPPRSTYAGSDQSDERPRRMGPPAAPPAGGSGPRPPRLLPSISPFAAVLSLGARGGLRSRDEHPRGAGRSACVAGAQADRRATSRRLRGDEWQRPRRLLALQGYLGALPASVVQPASSLQPEASLLGTRLQSTPTPG